MTPCDVLAPIGAVVLAGLAGGLIVILTLCVWEKTRRDR